MEAKMNHHHNPPQSLDESIDEIIDGDFGLLLSLNQAKRIVFEEKMKYSICISCP
jgi:hypothetical protein